MMNVDDVNNFDFDKMMRVLGSNNLTEDVNIKIAFYEDRAFKIVAASLLASLTLLIFNYLW